MDIENFLTICKKLRFLTTKIAIPYLIKINNQTYVCKQKKKLIARESFCELIESFFFILYERVRVVRHCVYFSLLFTLSCKLDFSSSGSRIFVRCRNKYFFFFNFWIFFCEEWSRLKIILIIFIFFSRGKIYVHKLVFVITHRTLCLYIERKKIETYDKVQAINGA